MLLDTYVGRFDNVTPAKIKIAFSKYQPIVVQCVYQINMFSTLQSLIAPQKLLILILTLHIFSSMLWWFMHFNNLLGHVLCMVNN